MVFEISRYVGEIFNSIVSVEGFFNYVYQVTVDVVCSFSYGDFKLLGLLSLDNFQFFVLLMGKVNNNVGIGICDKVNNIYLVVYIKIDNFVVFLSFLVIFIVIFFLKFIEQIIINSVISFNSFYSGLYIINGEGMEEFQSFMKIDLFLIRYKFSFQIILLMFVFIYFSLVEVLKVCRLVCERLL